MTATESLDEFFENSRRRVQEAEERRWQRLRDDMDASEARIRTTLRQSEEFNQQRRDRCQSSTN